MPPVFYAYLKTPASLSVETTKPVKSHQYQHYWLRNARQMQAVCPTPSPTPGIFVDQGTNTSDNGMYTSLRFYKTPPLQLLHHPDAPALHLSRPHVGRP
jgi:hypothetical protein